MKRFSEVLDSLSFKNSVYEQLRVRMALEHWKDIAGDALARHSEFHDFRHGVLYFCCDDPLWLSEASFLKTQLISRINAVLGKELVKDIKFRRCRSD